MPTSTPAACLGAGAAAARGSSRYIRVLLRPSFADTPSAIVTMICIITRVQYAGFSRLFGAVVFTEACVLPRNDACLRPQTFVPQPMRAAPMALDSRGPSPIQTDTLGACVRACVRACVLVCALLC